MFNQILTDIKTVPERLTARRDAIRERAILERTRARVRATDLRDRSHVRLWGIGTDTLNAADALLVRTRDLPVLPRLMPPVERAVRERLMALTAPGIENYDTLNARNAARAVRGLSRVELEKVRRYELGTKDRKTVYTAIARELQKKDQAAAV